MNIELVQQAQKCYLTVLSNHVKAIDLGYGSYQDSDIKHLIEFLEESKKKLDLMQMSLEVRLGEGE